MPLRLQLRERTFLGVQPQPGLAFPRVRPVAVEALVREDRPDLEVEVDLPRSRWFRARHSLAARRTRATTVRRVGTGHRVPLLFIASPDAFTRECHVERSPLHYIGDRRVTGTVTSAQPWFKCCVWLLRARQPGYAMRRKSLLPTPMRPRLGSKERCPCTVSVQSLERPESVLDRHMKGAPS